LKGLISDLIEIFNSQGKFNMKSNPEEFTFGVPLGKLLGYPTAELTITQKSINDHEYEATHKASMMYRS
jgi:hypothetical protein